MNKFFKASFITSAVVASAVIVQPVSASADSVKFTDVKEMHDYYADVYTLVERGIISGYDDHTYRPNAELTRGQAAKILAMALELEISPMTTSSFKDVSNKHQYSPYIEALVKEGIIDGYADGTFKPQNTLTRAQMAKILVKGFGLISEGDVLPFTDVTTKSGYYRNIQTLYTLGITKGNSATTFSPNAPVKRGQMASFVMRSERALATEPDVVEKALQEQLTDSIVKIDGKQVVLTKGSFEIPEKLQGLLSEKNSSALKNADIEMTVKGNQLLTISFLTITAQGTSEVPVILDGSMTAGPVASLTPMATSSSTSFDGVLNIESNYIQIRNLIVAKKLTLSNSVKEITLTYPVKELTVLEDAEVVIKGKSDIEKVTIASEKVIHLDVAGNIGELHLIVKKAALRLGAKSLIGNIQTLNGVTVDKLITNFSAIEMNIEKVNNKSIRDDKTNISVNPSQGHERPAIKENMINGKVVQKVHGQQASQASKTIVSYKFNEGTSSAMSNFKMNINDGDGYSNEWLMAATQKVNKESVQARTGVEVAEALVDDFTVTRRKTFTPLTDKWDITNVGSELIFTSKLNKAYDDFQITFPSNDNRAEVKGEFLKKQQGSQGIDGKVEMNVLTVDATVNKSGKMLVTFADGKVTSEKTITIIITDTASSLAAKIAAAFTDLAEWDVTNAKESAEVVFTSKEAMDDREITISIR